MTQGGGGRGPDFDTLKVRSERCSGAKHVLQRRLHGLLVQAAIQASIRKAECRKRKQQQIDLFGSDDSDLSADSDDGSSSSNSS